MKPLFAQTACVLLSMLLSAHAAEEVLFTETFDNALGFTTSDLFYSDGNSDYYGLGGVNDWGGDGTPFGLFSYDGLGTGPNGFLTGMDLDAESATIPITVTWTGINIDTYSNLQFSGLFAEDQTFGTDIDLDDILRIEAQIDGGGYFTVLNFDRGSFTDLINNEDGVFSYDGEAVTTTPKTFTAPIAGTGSLLDLRFTVSLDSGDEDFAVDNFQIISVPEPGMYLLLGLAGAACYITRRRSR